MSAVRSAFLASLLVVLGCSSATAPNPDAGICGPCGAGQGCDVSTRACAPASAEGARCGADAPAGAPLICQDGLSCGFVAGGVNICSRECQGASQCPSGQSCYLATQGSDKRQYCATPVAIGGGCGPDQLLQCSSANGVIVNCIADADGGICMQRCDAQTPCPAGQACSISFSDGAGVCGSPTAQGSPCDQTSLMFCTAGQVCVVESGSSGVCHLACGGDGGASCGSGDACIFADPCAASGQEFCVTPQPVDGGCAPADDEYCGPGTACVNLSGHLMCKPDCSAGQACTDSACQPLPAAGGGASCQSACL